MKHPKHHPVTIPSEDSTERSLTAIALSVEDSQINTTY